MTLVSQKDDPQQSSITALASDVQTLALGGDGSDDGKDLPSKPLSSKRKTLDDIKAWANQQSEATVSFVLIGTGYVGYGSRQATSMRGKAH